MNTTTNILWNEPGPGLRTVQSEWAKVRTLRSTWTTLVAAAAVSIRARRHRRRKPTR